MSPTSCGSLIPSEDGRLFPSKQHAYRWLLYRIRPSLNGMVSHVPFTVLQGSCHDVRSRCELPRDLARQIEDTRLHGEEVKELSVGLDGDWFLRTNIRRGRYSPTSNLVLPSIRPLHPPLTKTRMTAS